MAKDTYKIKCEKYNNPGFVVIEFRDNEDDAFDLARKLFSLKSITAVQIKKVKE